MKSPRTYCYRFRNRRRRHGFYDRQPEPSLRL
jgi:hypothetical protein